MAPIKRFKDRTSGGGGKCSVWYLLLVIILGWVFFLLYYFRQSSAQQLLQLGTAAVSNMAMRTVTALPPVTISATGVGLHLPPPPPLPPPTTSASASSSATEAAAAGKPSDNTSNNNRHLGHVHVIFSTDCEFYQDWQTLVMFQSAQRVGQKGPITRIASGCSEEKKLQLTALYAKLYPQYSAHFTPDFKHDNRTNRKCEYAP